MILDAITLSVIQAHLISVAEEMGVLTMQTARSNLIKEGGDFSTALFDGKGRLIEHGRDMPAHQGLFPVLVREALPRIDFNRLHAGTAFITNSEDVAGSHLNDMKLLMPVFYGERLVMWTASLAHWADVGGMVPGSYYLQASEIFQEGMQVPLIQIMEEDRIREDVLELIVKNMRGSRERLGDLMAQVAAVRFGARRIHELFDKYGADVVEAAFDGLIDYSERRMRAAIRQIPNGCYEFEDFMDNDGIANRQVRLKVAVTVAEDIITIDLSDCDKQTPGPINSPFAQTCSAAYYAVRGVTDIGIPANDGLFRPITVVTKRGSVVDCDPGTARVCCTHETANRLVDLCLGALAEAVPDRVPAAGCGSSFVAIVGGRNPRTDAHYTWYEPVPGGFGARPGLDGIDGTRVHMGNTANTPVEVFERDYPLICDVYELLTDSGGPGRYRGGLGSVKRIRAADLPGNRPICTAVSDRNHTQPYGLSGGGAGRNGRVVIDANESSERQPPGECPGKSSYGLQPHESWAIFAAGGGGWGDPKERPVELVLDDVIDGKVSVRAAASDYGVVIDPSNSRIDADATVLRRRRRGASE